MGGEAGKRTKPIKPVTTMGKWSFIPQGTSGPHVNWVSAIGFIYQLPLAISQRGPEKQGGHFSGNPCLPGGRQHTAAPRTCFWKMGTPYMGGPKEIWQAPASVDTSVKTHTRAKQ